MQHGTDGIYIFFFFCAEKLEKEKEKKKEQEAAAAEEAADRAKLTEEQEKGEARGETKGVDLENGNKKADDDDDDGDKEEEEFQKRNKKRLSKYKTLTEHEMGGYEHTVQLKQISPLDSREMIENEMLGVAADKKAKKFLKIAEENHTLKEKISRLEQVTRSAKRSEMSLRTTNRKMTMQISTLKSELLKLRVEHRGKS